MIINSESELTRYVLRSGVLNNYDAVVVEGYDGVGKGRVLELISDTLGIKPYRPDYNLWQKYNHRQIDRWKVSGFFWDVYSHFVQEGGLAIYKLMLFDRGVISGAVYNDDLAIARDYKSIIRDARILHILVTCNRDDFIRFQKQRNDMKPFVESDWIECSAYTEKYREAFHIAGVDMIEYQNHFSEDTAKYSSTCKGCGHYSYGICRHPEINKEVDGTSPRCDKSFDKEIQDREVEENVAEMHCL